ncbi:MAG: hypothetical protein R6X07_16410 [Desulfatiglandales bacterium]
MFSRNSHRKGLEERQDFSPLLEVAACEFTHNEGVTHDMAVLQQVFEDRLADTVQGVPSSKGAVPAFGSPYGVLKSDR